MKALEEVLVNKVLRILEESDAKKPKPNLELVHDIFRKVRYYDGPLQ